MRTSPPSFEHEADTFRDIAAAGNHMKELHTSKFPTRFAGLAQDGDIDSSENGNIRTLTRGAFRGRYTTDQQEWLATYFKEHTSDRASAGYWESLSLRFKEQFNVEHSNTALLAQWLAFSKNGETNRPTDSTNNEQQSGNTKKISPIWTSEQHSWLFKHMTTLQDVRKEIRWKHVTEEFNDHFGGSRTAEAIRKKWAALRLTPQVDT